MAGRKEYKKIDIDVEPFLSIMAIVMKLISLILVVIVMRIAMNSKKKRIVSLDLWASKNNIVDAKEPRYIDCFPDKVVIYPGNITNNWTMLQHPNNDVERVLDRVQENSSNEYVVIMARPESVKFFRTVRKMAGQRTIDVGYDAVDADFQVNWNEARKALSVKEDDDDETTNAPAPKAEAAGLPKMQDR